MEKIIFACQYFEDAGLTLGYHNHSYEFKALPSGKLPIECMMDHNENLKLEIDLGGQLLEVQILFHGYKNIQIKSLVVT